MLVLLLFYGHTFMDKLTLKKRNEIVFRKLKKKMLLSEAYSDIGKSCISVHELTELQVKSTEWFL